MTTDLKKFSLTPRQEEALTLISPATVRYCLLYGGSRSGKTFLLVFLLVIRALKKKSRHVVLRFRFAHVKQTIWYGTLPKVMDLLGLKRGEHYHENKSDWFISLANGSEIWFGGLDEKERVEKILGNEYSTIYLNEASYIPYNSYLLAMTRLAENSGLALKCFVDCNPPSRMHWTHKVFIEGIDPKNNRPIDKTKYVHMLMNPADNQDNLPSGFISDVLEGLPEAQRNRFLLGQWGSDDEGTYYAEILNTLEAQGRLLDFDIPKDIVINTAWDIGYGDSTAIWFFYQKGQEIFVCDYLEDHGKGLDYYIQQLRLKEYKYGTHYAPHDMDNGNFQTGKSSYEAGLKLGVRFKVVPKLSIQDGINACRVILPRCFFNMQKTLDGFEYLKSYRKEFSEKHGVFKRNPIHDKASHAADAFRYLCVGLNEKTLERVVDNPYNFESLLKHSTLQRIMLEDD